MRLFYTILFLLVYNLSFTQDIVSLPIVTRGAIQLGGKAKIQFNINQETLCDTYSITWDIDYFTKTINVNLDYYYNSACSESTIIFTESPEKQISLIGVYFVKLNLNVPTNPSWNDQFNLGTILVFEPQPQGCSAAFIPFLEEVCPIVSNPNCACNGITYINECVAHLEQQHGAILSITCPDYLNQIEEAFDCQNFTSTDKNFFELYECSIQYYQGKEIVLSYQHLLNDTLDIDFTTTADDVSLILVQIEGDNLSCLAISSDNKLFYPNLPGGNYYLIADRLEDAFFEINFCTSTASTDITSSGRHIYPNPASEYITIESTDHPIQKASIYNLHGVLIKEILVNKEVSTIETIDLNGMYFLKVDFDNNKSQISKILIRN